MNLMNLNLDGVRIEEEVTVPADGIVTLGHNLFKPEPLDCYYDSKKLTAGQDYVLHGVDERLYYQKNVTLFTKIKILNDFLLNKVIKVTYYACGDYVDANIWRDYPTAADLKNSLASKVDNKVFLDEVARLDEVIIAEATVREQSDTQLREKLASETNLRTAADEQLQEKINDEAKKRKSADEGLTASIAAEAEARTAQDDILSENIRQEEDTRAAADEQLQLQVTDLKTKFESFVPGLTYKVVAQLPTENILSDVIYMVPAGTQGENQVYDEYLYIDDVWELIGSTATTQAITVDQALSSTSENPVQNKTIFQALEKKLDINAKEFAGMAALAVKLLGQDGLPLESRDDDTPIFWGSKGCIVCKDTNGWFGGPNGVILNLVTGVVVIQIAFYYGGSYEGRQGIRVGYTDTNEWKTGWEQYNLAAIEEKLDGIEAGAQKNPSAATQSAAGLMSAADKKKLDGIATGANAYSHPTYTARTGVPTVNQTPAFGGTFSVTQPVSNATGHITAMNTRTITIPDTTATESAAGLMSKADKRKLNNLKYSGNGPVLVATLSSYESMILCCNRYGGGYLLIENANTPESVSGKVYVNNVAYTGTIGLTAGKYYVIIVTEAVSVNVRLSQNGGGGYTAIRI